MTRHIVEPDPIGIKIVENCKAKLIALSIIWLWTLCPSSVRPVNIIVSLTRGPFYSIPIVDLSTSPEVPLSVFCDQSKKLPFFCSTVKTNGSHTISTTECLPFTLGELGASYPPAYEEILPLITVIWFKSSPLTASSSIASSFWSSVSILLSNWPSVIWSSILLLTPILLLTSISYSVVIIPIVIPIVIPIPL